jgi:RHS repeat-associated protein
MASVAHLEYDSMERLVRMDYSNAAGSLVRQVVLAYDAAGMIVTNRITGGGAVAEHRYSLDGLDRLTGETVLDGTGGVRSVAGWQYDLAGNRTNAVVNGTNTAYAYAAANRLTSWSGGGTMGFDAAGNVTNLVYPGGRTLGLEWNGRYEVVALTTNGASAERAGYDATRRRVWSWDTSSSTNWFVYDGPHVVAEVDGAGVLKRSYVYAPGIDDVLSMSVYGATTNTYYYLKDHLGSVLALADASVGVVESYEYDAWGHTVVFDGSGNPLAKSAVGNRYCWQGREISWATGLYYFRARWYDPVTGRWLSNDPIGISGGLNQYVFCGDEPVGCRDPEGLMQVHFYDGKDVNGGATGKEFRRAANIRGFFTYDIHELEMGMCGALDQVRALGFEIDAIYIWDHGNADGQQYGDITLHRYPDFERMAREVGARIEPGGTVHMMGCFVGKNPDVLQMCANAFGRRVTGTQFDVLYNRLQMITGIFRPWYRSRDPEPLRHPKP